MRAVLIDQIVLALVGNEVAITLRSECSDCVRTRLISLESAVAISLLLDGGAFHWALNFAVKPGVSLQIENLPYERASLTISEECHSNGHDLVACIQGEGIAEIGRLFNDLVVAARGRSRKAKATIHVRSVEHCYLDNEIGT